MKEYLNIIFRAMLIVITLPVTVALGGLEIISIKEMLMLFISQMTLITGSVLQFYYLCFKKIIDKR